MTGRILILAGDTDGNLGDLAIVTATCETLRRFDPSLEISLVTSRPQRDRKRLGISPIPRGWRGLPALAGAARRADLVICGGGGLFQDDDSLLKMPYWALRLGGVRLFARRIAGLAIGAGPLDYGASRAFARLALKSLDTVSVRDALAQRTLEPLTRKAVEVVPDPAFLLEPADGSAAERALRAANAPVGDAPLVGVALRRWFHKHSSLLPYQYAARFGAGRSRGSREMSRLTENLAHTLDDVVTGTGAHIVFMPTYNVPHENDRAVCEAVAARMRSTAVSMLELDDPKLYMAVTGRLKLMLCGRMHAAILAAALGTPVIGIAYNPKFQGMFDLLGQADRCLPIAAFLHDCQGKERAAMLSGIITSSSPLRPETGELRDRTRRFLGSLTAGSSRADATLQEERR